jgi:hypothetical protein
MAMYKAPGAPLKDVFWTLSQCDAIATLDAPSDVAIMALGWVGVQRAHRTLRVCSRAEMHRSSAGSACRGRWTCGTAHDAPWVRVVVPGGVRGGA